ncbi:MAG: hypothetical protein KGL75_06320 [Acidobacteriota bacterium]|nr:hypothetical protein [Acidobacteriota bacterium]
MIPHGIAIGIGITALTAALLIAGYFRSRRHRLYPLYGWMGIASLVCAEVLMFRGVDPVATYFTPIAWTAYILVADAAVLAISGRSRLNDAPLVLGRIALLSIPLWLIFEAYNLRLHNWTYVGVPREWPSALLGYGWSFATIFPAIFETSDLIQAILPPLPGRPWRISRNGEIVLVAIGAACLIVPVALPPHTGAYLFGIVWIGFFLLLDPLNHWLHLPSFIGDFSEGFRRRACGFFLAGWVCGWLWEFWNYWAAAKWRYTFPLMQREKIFEMPVVGFLGFLPFALECFCMYVTAAWLAGWVKRVK